MSVFLDSNFTLVANDLIVIRVKAKNDLGWATNWSPDNTGGVLVLTVPDTPLNKPRKGVGSSDS